MNARQEWLTARKQGIGGSDVAAILGLSKWKTPYSVWQDKVGQAAEIPDNAAMKWGRNLEPVVRQEYSEATGRIVLQPADMLRHPVHSFMLANLDGMTNDRRVVEIKTARSGQGWGEEGTDQIPQDYMFQVQHYMAVTEFPVADVAVLIAGSDFRIYEVPADSELQEMMIEAEAEFWKRVVNMEPPEPTTMADAIAKYGRTSRVASVTATTEVYEALETLKSIKRQVATLEESEEAAKAVIFKAMADNDTLVDSTGKPLATWKTQAGSSRIDTALLKSVQPDVYSQYLKQSDPSRRFLLKA